MKFCSRFVIETGCPRSSQNLRAPGDLEQHLLTLLGSRLGIGHYPNSSRDLGDAAAQLIQLATAARGDKQSRGPEHVTSALALITDFGRVSEHLPLDPNLLVSIPNARDELVGNSKSSGVIVVRGVPGAGKSWLLETTRRQLLEQGQLAVAHYCFVELQDPHRDRRSTIEVIFGSLIAELYDLDPALVADGVPRYAAGPRELKAVLTTAVRKDPDLRITLIVDGLDHADRLNQPGPGMAGDIAQELAALDLPDSVRLIVGSQPGAHLAPLLRSARVIDVRPWSDAHIRSLGIQAGLTGPAVNSVFVEDIGTVLDTIVDKARGNPLYATYLARTALGMMRGDIAPGTDLDVVGYLSHAPVFDDDLASYYDWLFRHATADSGAAVMIRALALVGVPLTVEELCEVFPLLGTVIPNVVLLLAPVLMDGPDTDGVRIYHESFQRFIRNCDTGVGNDSHQAMLSPIRDWLDKRGFFQDLRAFRWLFPVLHAADQDADIVQRCTHDFVVNATAHGQPGDAVLANLAIAAQAAMDLNALPDLTRIVELNRAADYQHHWRLDNDELAHVYGRAFAAIHGVHALADRLLHDGRPAFQPRVGVVLCRLCDDQGVTPPWSAYLTTLGRWRAANKVSYLDGEAGVDEAVVVGELRLAGPAQAPELLLSWLSGYTENPVHSFTSAQLYALMYGEASLREVIDRLDHGPDRGWACLAAAFATDEAEAAKELATEALAHDLDDARVIRWAIKAGVDPTTLSTGQLLDELTTAVNGEFGAAYLEPLAAWLSELDIAATTGDEKALRRNEKGITGHSWYRQWLKFCVRTRLRPAAPDVLEELQVLVDVERFGGRPQPAELYAVESEIRQSLHDALSIMDDARYEPAASALFALANKVNPWPTLRSGALPVDEVLRILLSTADSRSKRDTASRLGAERLESVNRIIGIYDIPAEDQFMLAILHKRAERMEAAQEAWTEGCLYLAAYGDRKDITISELVDPLPALHEGDPIRIPASLAAAQPLVEAVVTHTDKRGTVPPLREWADHAATLHPAGGLLYTALRALATPLNGIDLSHAMAAGAAALQDVVCDEVLQGFWVALGTVAAEEPEAALSACERPTEHSVEAWQMVSASLVDHIWEDRSRIAALVAASATRIGQPSPTDAADEPEDHYASPASVAPARHSDFVLPEHASAVQVAHEIRRWRAESRPADVDTVAATILSRLLTLDTENADEAESLLHRLGRDVPLFYPDPLLRHLAESLEHHRPALAATAYTLTYTRATEGLRQFAGREWQHLFLRALELDHDRAWRTLLREVVESIGPNTRFGVTVHFIELLAAAGRVDDAYACWEQVRAVIAQRLPPLTPTDAPILTYDPTADDPWRGIAACLVARLADHAGREVATEGVMLLLHSTHTESAQVLAHAIDIAARHEHRHVFNDLLGIVEQFEVAPFPVTRLAASALKTASDFQWRSISDSARTLLRRANKHEK
ncbi:MULTISPECIES: hypothetical protein [Actinosynnema]|uniref:hypothetical protein n=1 Tax=Actinosynnema TaxID=40566 RepID=UPI0020A3E0FE|nr:hypothetical protein [Actinosynnema pretiosum]MCP2094727.1 NACHT domain [Actinosynnema pretiosum]